MHGGLADRIGTESVTTGRRGERVGGLAPACPGEQDDGGDVEEDAIECRPHAVRVDLGQAGEVEQDRRRAALELLDGAPGSRRRVHDLADVPSAAATAALDGFQRVGRGVQRLDDDAVVRRRTQAVERHVRIDLQRLGDGASQSSRVADAVMPPG